jgi:hypothetical protein
MAQHLADLGQRHLRGDHLAGHRVTQAVRSDLGGPGSSARAAHGRGDGAGRQRPDRRPRPQEHLPPTAGRAPPTRVAGDRVADVGGQRQPVLAPTLAMDKQFPPAPVDVIQRQGGDLAAAQPEPSSVISTA